MICLVDLRGILNVIISPILERSTKQQCLDVSRNAATCPSSLQEHPVKFQIAVCSSDSGAHLVLENIHHCVWCIATFAFWPLEVGYIVHIEKPEQTSDQERQPVPQMGCSGLLSHGLTWDQSCSQYLEAAAPQAGAALEKASALEMLVIDFSFAFLGVKGINVDVKC